MITIDFAFAVAIFLFVAILLVIGWWIFYTYKDEESMRIESKNLQQCPYCTYLFFDYSADNFAICPRCESYIIKPGKHL